eukprot:scaffold287006_cov28-Prasinocladus_malaysianus.AAC.1
MTTLGVMILPFIGAETSNGRIRSAGFTNILSSIVPAGQTARYGGRFGSWVSWFINVMARSHHPARHATAKPAKQACLMERQCNPQQQSRALRVLLLA